MSLKPGKLIITTSWDDGKVTDISLSKLLIKYSIKSTFYVPFIHPGPEKQLDSSTIKQISENIEIGAHSLTHRPLDKLDSNQIWKEVSESKSRLEEIIDKDVISFCYPSGRYNSTVTDIIEKAGFLGARTCRYSRFDFPGNVFEWGITMHASNGSPLTTFNIVRDLRLPVHAYFDWEVRAKMMFDIALRTGGIYHLWGHSSEINNKQEWEKLERVLAYISKREGAIYLTNGEILTRALHD